MVTKELKLSVTWDDKDPECVCINIWSSMMDDLLRYVLDHRSKYTLEELTQEERKW